LRLLADGGGHAMSEVAHYAMLPALTAPFVLVTWLFLLPKAGFKTLQPVALAEVSTAENTRASYRVREAGPSATPEPGEAT
jgi:hypothetical protein